MPDESSDLVARVLTRSAQYGTVGYLTRVALKRQRPTADLLAKMHTPNRPGPGHPRERNKRV